MMTYARGIRATRVTTAAEGEERPPGGGQGAEPIAGPYPTRPNQHPTKWSLRIRCSLRLRI